MAKRRVRTRFVLSVLAAAALAGMIASTAWVWRVEAPWSNRSSDDFFDERAMVCWENRLWVDWILVPRPDGRTSDAEPPTTEDVKKIVARLVIDEECASELDRAFREIDTSTAGFRRLAPGGWVFGCQLWLVRSVLGGLLALSLWGAWCARRRWAAGSCQRCGYDRAGLAAPSVCPECGAPGRTPAACAARL